MFQNTPQIALHKETGKSFQSLVQISKGYDSCLDERGRGKAKKLANTAIYRLFDRMCVSFGVAIICLKNRLKNRVNRFNILCP